MKIKNAVLVPFVCAALFLMTSCPQEVIKPYQSYTITYDSQGADVPASPTSQSTGSNGKVSNLPSAPTKAGLNFGGWWTGVSGSGSQFSTDYYVSSNMAVYAYWIDTKITVTFDSQNADILASPSLMTVQAIGTLPQLPADPVRTGYRFSGWWTLTNGNGEQITVSTVFVKNSTVFAKWILESYLVTFDSQEADTPASPSGITVNNVAHTMNVLPSVPVKIGYLFGGWYTSPAGQGNKIDVNSVIKANMTVYAYWSLNGCVVTFNDWGATTSVSPDKMIVIKPATALSTMPTSPKKTGYNFSGWYTGPNGTGSVFTVNSPVNYNMTVYANWTSYSYNINFQSQFADINAFPSTINVASPQSTLGTMPSDPIKAGYTFAGWWTASNGGGTEVTSTTEITGSRTVYAKWTLNGYKISFDSQGANVAATPSSIIVIKPATTLDNLPTEPVRTGYIFGGWWTGPNGSGTPFSVPASVTTDLVVYAKWISYSYSVSFDSQGADTPATPAAKTIASPTTMIGTLPTAPLKVGYIFGGWWTESNGAGTQLLATTMITSNLSVYAKWTYSGPIVTFDSQSATTAASPSRIAVVSPATTLSWMPSIPEKTGYAFVGWRTQSDGGGDVFDLFSAVPADTTVYAHWIPCTAGLSYTLLGDDTYSVSRGSVSNGMVIIPEYWRGKKVTQVAANGFSVSTAITSIVFPESISSIGNGAFYNCDNLVGNLVLPSQLKSIGASAFFGCDSLGGTLVLPQGLAFLGASAFFGSSIVSLQLPDSLEIISDNAFESCFKLTSIVFSAKLSSIGVSAFARCYGLTGGLTLPASLKTIGATAFYGCTKITRLEVPTTMTSIGTRAFQEMSGLTSFVWPAGVTSINECVFYGCTSLASISMPDTLTSIGSESFYSCTSLTGPLIIPDSVEMIGKSAFYNCSHIKSLDMSAGVVEIGDQSFYNCTELAGTLNLPSTLRSIGYSAFYRCTSLLTLNCEPGLEEIGTGAFYECTNLTGSVVLPETVVTIGNSAFSRCSNLLIVSLPASVTSLGSDVFSECKKLVTASLACNISTVGERLFGNCENLTGTITIPNGVTTIAANAFTGCISLTGVVFPDTLQSINDYAFYYCGSLSGNLVFPEKLVFIGDFAFSSCNDVTNISFPASLLSIGNSSFSNCTALSSLNLPAKLVSLGTYAFSNCSGILNSLVIPSSLTMIKESAFSGCKGIPSVSFPSTLTVLGGSGFSGCLGLTGELNLPNALSSIGPGAFYNCKKITSFTLPSGLTRFPDRVFEGCSGLTGVLNISSNIVSIGEGAFDGCSGLSSIKFPASLTSIGNSAFSSCTGLTGTLIVPDTITSWGTYVFSGCTKITSIILPANFESIPSGLFRNCSGIQGVLSFDENITAIGDSAFSGCTGITEIELPDGLQTIGASSFSGCTGLSTLTFPDSLISISDSAFSSCAGLTGTIVLPDQLPSLGSRVFAYCTKIGRVVLPSNLQAIPELFFSGCTGLSTISIPDTVTTIGREAFQNCSSLTMIILPDNLTAVYYYAFNKCNGLTAITIPDKVGILDMYSFANCLKLETVTLLSTVPPSAGNNLFSGSALLSSIQVPSASVSAYKAAPNWSAYSTIITAIP